MSPVLFILDPAILFARTRFCFMQAVDWKKNNRQKVDRKNAVVFQQNLSLQAQVRAVLHCFPMGTHVVVIKDIALNVLYY